jgi:hypothetical protein
LHILEALVIVYLDIFFRRCSREDIFLYLGFKKAYINFQSINQKQKQTIFFFFD